MSTTQGKKMHLSFQPVIYSRLVEMSTDRGVSIPEVIRTSIQDAFEKFQRVKYGYKGSAGGTRNDKKADRLAIIASLRSMTDDQLTTHLIDIGYSAPWEPMADVDDVEYRELVRSDAAGNKFFCVTYYNTTQKKETGFSQRFTFDELIKNLIKEQKI